MSENKEIDLEHLLEEEYNYQISGAKIVFSNIDSIVYHLKNTFDISFVPRKNFKRIVKDVKKSTLYYVNITPKVAGSVPSFTSKVKYIGVCLEYHSIVRNESNSTYGGKLHFEADKEIAYTAGPLLEATQFKVLMTMLNLQLHDYVDGIEPTEKRTPYLKDLREYKINMSQYAKFTMEEYHKRKGKTCFDIAFGWTVPNEKDSNEYTIGITLQLCGYKYRTRNVAAEKMIGEARKRKNISKEVVIAEETIKKSKNDEEPEMTV